MKKINRAAAALLSVMLGTGSVISAFAAVNEGLDTIDTTRKGSITIHKYDDTAQNLPEADGEEDTEVSTAMASHAVAGVEYTYLKLGDVQTKSTVSDGVNYVQIYYDIPDAFAAILGLTGGTAIEDLTGTYYTSDAVIAAMSDALSADRAIASKNAIYDYLTGSSAASTVVTGSDGAASVSDLSLGLYLFAETKVPQNVSSSVPFLVSLPMTSSDADTWLYTVHAYPKNQHDVPVIDKQVKTERSSAYGDYGSASGKDTVDYRVVTRLPEIQDKATYLTVWTVNDTLESGLDYVNPTTGTVLKAYDTLEALDKGTVSTTLSLTSEDYQVTRSADTPRSMTISLTTAGLAKVNAPANSGKYLVYTYTAKVNEGAVLGDLGNDNTAQLTWGRTNTTYTQTIEDKARVYTYALDLTKVLSDTPEDAEQLLPTVQFTLYDETGKHDVSADETTTTGVYRVNDADTEGYLFSPSGSGSLKIEGLAAGTYTLTEVKSASGYALLKEPVTIVITSSQATAAAGTAGHNDANASENDRSTAASLSTTTGAKASVDGSTVTMSASGTASTNAYVPTQITNTKTWIPSLPKTGGMGTWLIVLIGALGIGIGVFFSSRAHVRKNRG